MLLFKIELKISKKTKIGAAAFKALTKSEPKIDANSAKLIKNCPKCVPPKSTFSMPLRAAKPKIAPKISPMMMRKIRFVFL